MREQLEQRLAQLRAEFEQGQKMSAGLEARAQRWFCLYAEAPASAEQGLHASRQIQDVYLEALCLREIGLAARETGDYGQAQTAINSPDLPADGVEIPRCRSIVARKEVRGANGTAE